MSPRGVYKRKPKVEKPPKPVVEIAPPEEPDLLDRPPAGTPEDLVQRHETCGRCHGDGMCNVAHPPASGQGDPSYRMERCPVCNGTGVDRTKPLVVEGEAVVFGEAEELRVVEVRLPAVMKPWGQRPGWKTVYGVIADGADRAEPSSYRGLFPDREAAERFAGGL